MQTERRTLFLLLAAILILLAFYLFTTTTTRYQMRLTEFPLVAFRLDRWTGEVCLVGVGDQPTGIQFAGTSRRFGRIACTR